MNELTLAEIELTGENFVETWLAENGYSNITKAVVHSNTKEIRANSKLEGIIVQVKTFLHPARPFKLSEYEAHKITLRASRNKNTAYAAYVVIDSNKELVGEIQWERLR